MPQDLRHLGGALRTPNISGIRYTAPSAVSCLSPTDCAAWLRLQVSGRRSGRPLTDWEGWVPEAQGPEEDRDEVLNPTVERGRSECHRRQMGGCCVVEDTDQNVDREEKPDFAEKGPYISGNSLVCAAPGSEGEPCRHLSSPPPADDAWSSRRQGSAASRRLFGPILHSETSHGTFSRIVGTSPSAALTCRMALSPMWLKQDAALWAPITGKPDSRWWLPRSTSYWLTTTTSPTTPAPNSAGQLRGALPTSRQHTFSQDSLRHLTWQISRA